MILLKDKGLIDDLLVSRVSRVSRLLKLQLSSLEKTPCGRRPRGFQGGAKGFFSENFM